MRISSSSALLALALCGTAAGQDLFSNMNVVGLTDGIALSGPRCDAAEATKVTTTESGPLRGPLVPVLLTDGLIIDGCAIEWGEIKGSRRERGDLFLAANGGDYNDCDRTKVTVRGDAKDGNDTAVVSSTSTLYGEETRAAQSYLGRADNRGSKYTAPASGVFNTFFSANSTGTAQTSNFYCSDVSRLDQSSTNLPTITLPANASGVFCDVMTDIDTNDRTLIYTIANYGSSTLRGLKAVLTFTTDFESIKFYLPRGSPRVPLPAVDGSNRAAAGTVIKGKTMTLPLASKTVGPDGILIGSLFWAGFPQLNSSLLTGANVTLTVTQGARKVVCESGPVAL